MKAIIYTRVSTGKQQDQGVSLEAQKDSIIKYCASNGYSVIATYSDTMTASTAQRPEFIKALAEAKTGKSALIVYHTSRFSRDTIDQLVIEKELRKAGSKLVSITDTVETDTPQGEMMFTMMAAYNRMERRLIGERTKAALQHMKAQGKRVGSIPHGYKLEGDKLIKDEAGQEIIKLVKALRKQGYSLRNISDELAEKGAFNCNGSKYAAKSISSMLAA